MSQEATATASGAAEDVDPHALLAALVLVPHSYPRNRFFSLFERPGARVARRRAALLRSIIVDLLGDARGLELTREPTSAGGRVWLRYHLEGVGVDRRTLLDETELALVKVAVDRAEPRPDLAADADASELIRRLLRRLFEPDDR